MMTTLVGDTREDGHLVTVVRGLYVRFRQLIHEAAKFGVVGVIGLFVTNGVYALLHAGMNVGPVTSTTIATIVATAVTFVGNRYWSFQHRERPGVAREGVTFFVLNGVGLLIQDAAVAFNAYVLGNQHDRFSGFVALNLGIALATLFRFWSYRKWVWAPAGPDAGTVAGPEPQPPAAPPVPVHAAAWQRQPGGPQAGNGQDPDLARVNGNGVHDRTRASRSPMDGWDS
jgi:putative flippase GtrA